MKILLKREDINTNVTDNIGNTPLMWACAYGYTDIVRFLLADKRVNRSVENEDGRLANEVICIIPEDKEELPRIQQLFQVSEKTLKSITSIVSKLFSFNFRVWSELIKTKSESELI